MVCGFYKVKLLLLRGKVVFRKAMLFVPHNRVGVFSLLRPKKKNDTKILTEAETLTKASHVRGSSVRL